MAAKQTPRVTDRFFGHINDAIIIEAPDEHIPTRRLFERAVERIDIDMPYDLFIDHAADPEWAGERSVRCDRILVPEEAYADVEPPEGVDNPQAIEEIMNDKAANKAADYLSDHLKVDTPGVKTPPSFHLDRGTEMSTFDHETLTFGDGHKADEGFDITAAVGRYAKSQRPNQ